jgi:biotin synthase-like enzyme
MYIVLGIEAGGGEIYGKGETIEDAVKDLESLIYGDGIEITHYYKCEEIQVIKTRNFKIL